MLSSILRSEQAVLANIEIMRAFVRLREIMSTHHELAKKLDALEQKYVLGLTLLESNLPRLSERTQSWS